jgi:23S rRNA pseudouridine1911/1915/1917 synthase
MDLPVLYSDADIIVVDKPVGMAAHASPGWDGPTVVSALSRAGFVIDPVGVEERHGIVHRLDVGTSGVMVVAKSAKAYSALKRDFKKRAVDKTYHALVQGHPDPAAGTIDAPIGRDPRHQHRFAVTADGRPSITHYTTLESHHYASLLEIGLETGRTHQIRVHMSAVHHPCCGDLTYGGDPVLAQRLGLTRQWLHAVRLGLRHPGTGDRVAFTSGYPADLAHALAEIRRG